MDVLLWRKRRQILELDQSHRLKSVLREEHQLLLQFRRAQVLCLVLFGLIRFQLHYLQPPPPRPAQVPPDNPRLVQRHLTLFLQLCRKILMVLSLLPQLGLHRARS